MMDAAAFARAVETLVHARRTGTRPEALPDGAHPANIAEAHAVQDAVLRALGEPVAGWKVSIMPDGVMRGAVLGARVMESPAAMSATGMPLLGVEGEIAFLFERDLPPREAEYTPEEVAEAAIAVVGIEIVGTRFRDYDRAPPMDRTADCMSNEVFVMGTRRPDWRGRDLAVLEATLMVNGETIVRQVGGHVTKHPILPAVALVNALRREGGVRAGQFITTGTFTGMHRAAIGDEATVSFAGFGTASIVLTR
jgi:2-keto-4-pentenoate hydratase